MEQSISSETAIYNRIEPEAEPVLPAPRMDQCAMLCRLLTILAAADCLSARGRVLKAWIDATGGAPVRSNSDDVIDVMRAAGHAHAYHVTVHLKAISNDPTLGQHFRYVLCRKSPHT